MLFEKKGPVNTETAILLAVERAQDLGIKHFVVASNTGETAQELLKHGVEQVVVVTHHSGYLQPGCQEMAPDVMAKLQDAGAKLLTTTHLLGGIDRAVENKFGGSYPGGIVAHTLRMLGQGTKVCLEIAVMALDAGMIPHGEDIMAIGGSGCGADTAAVIRPAHAKDFFDCKMKEIVCKPRNF